MPPGEASTFPPPLLPRARRRSTTTASCSRSARHGPLPRQQRAARDVARRCSRCCSTSLAGYAFAKLRFAGRDRIFRALLGALVIPAQVAMVPLFLLLKQTGPGQHATAACIVPAMASDLRHLPRPPVRARRSPTSCSTPRASTAPASCASSARSSCRVLKPILVTLGVFTLPRHLERLHVAADRADRRRDLYTLPVALASLSREHVQDNELMMAGAVRHRAAGAAGVPRPAALLHRRA